MLNWMLKFLLAVLLCTGPSEMVTATLTPNYVGRPCPGEQVTFTCTVSEVQLIWDPSDDSTILINMLRPTVTRGEYTAVLTSSNTTSLTSTLSTTARDGVTIECETVGSITIQVAGPPSPPQNLNHDIQSSTPDVAIVSVEWDPPVDNGGRNDLNYTVNISPSTQLSATVVTSTTVTVTAVYGVDYTLSVMATNCAGDSTTVEYMFSILGCPIPTNLMEGVIFPVTSRAAAGTTVTYQCTEGFMPTRERTATCLNTLMWSPNPETFLCVLLPTTDSPILCAPPLPPQNGSLGNNPPTSDSPLGTIITFQCDDGLFPMNVMTAICTDDSGNGVWEPDPASLVCRAQPVDCGVPDEPVNGRISDYCNLATFEGSVITFQCNPGLSPEGVMTATCTNDGVWIPDSAGVECKKSTSLTISTGAAVGITFGITFTVSVIVGFIAGLLVMYLSMTICYKKHKQIYHLPASRDSQTANITQQTPPAGPVYEEVSAPKEEIELKTNQAYGPVGQ